MLPRACRMRHRAEFTLTVRRGHRASRPTTVGYLLLRPEVTDPPRVGFVVGRNLGPAVVRNRARRRLRHLMRERLPLLPTGSLFVVRANPPAATATHHELAADLDRVLQRLVPGRREQVGTRD